MKKDALFRRKAPGIMADLQRDFPQIGLLDSTAILGNIGGESGGFRFLQEIKPTVPGSRGGWGWCQWTGARRRAFERWCKAKDLDPASDEANYGYLVHELRTSEKGAIAAMLSAGDLRTKVIAFERAFERAGSPHWEGRLKWAQIALEEYNKIYGPPADVPLPRPRPEEAPDVDVAPRQPDDPGPGPDLDRDPTPAPAKPRWYQRLWAKVSGAIGIGGGLGYGGLTLDGELLKWLAVLVVVSFVVFLGWVYLVPPRGQIRKGLL